MKSAIFAAALGAALVNGQRLADSSCDDVHVFIAKGNNEPYPGRQGKLVAAICGGLANCDYEDIQFYNPRPAPYCDSVAEGAANGVAQITHYHERCPDTKLVVSGYSQGGQIVGDILGGGGGVLFEGCQQPGNAGISADSSAGKKIVAALIFGDVRYTANQPYNYLNGAGSNGVFPRPPNQLANLGAYTGRFRNYCDKTDPICAGGDVVENHLNYFDIYTDSAAAWVQNLVRNAPNTGDDEESEEPEETPSKSSSLPPVPTTVIPPKYENGTIITTTICPEVTSAIDAVATSYYPPVNMTFAPGPSGSLTIPVDYPTEVPTGSHTEGAPSTVPTAGASTLQKSGLGLVVLALSAFALM